MDFEYICIILPYFFYRIIISKNTFYFYKGSKLLTLECIKFES